MGPQQPASWVEGGVANPDGTDVTNYPGQALHEDMAIGTLQQVVSLPQQPSTSVHPLPVPLVSPHGKLIPDTTSAGASPLPHAPSTATPFSMDYILREPPANAMGAEGASLTQPFVSPPEPNFSQRAAEFAQVYPPHKEVVDGGFPSDGGGAMSGYPVPPDLPQDLSGGYGQGGDHAGVAFPQQPPTVNLPELPPGGVSSNFTDPVSPHFPPPSPSDAGGSSYSEKLPTLQLNTGFPAEEGAGPEEGGRGSNGDGDKLALHLQPFSPPQLIPSDRGTDGVEEPSEEMEEERGGEREEEQMVQEAKKPDPMDESDQLSPMDESDQLAPTTDTTTSSESSDSSSDNSSTGSLSCSPPIPEPTNQLPTSTDPPPELRTDKVGGNVSKPSDNDVSSNIVPPPCPSTPPPPHPSTPPPPHPSTPPPPHRVLHRTIRHQYEYASEDDDVFLPDSPLQPSAGSTPPDTHPSTVTVTLPCTHPSTDSSSSPPPSAAVAPQSAPSTPPPLIHHPTSQPAPTPVTTPTTEGIVGSSVTLSVNYNVILLTRLQYGCRLITGWQVNTTMARAV